VKPVDDTGARLLIRGMGGLGTSETHYDAERPSPPTSTKQLDFADEPEAAVQRPSPIVRHPGGARTHETNCHPGLVRTSRSMEGSILLVRSRSAIQPRAHSDVSRFDAPKLIARGNVTFLPPAQRTERPARQRYARRDYLSAEVSDQHQIVSG
jgi:hypothetical protein